VTCWVIALICNKWPIQIPLWLSLRTLSWMCSVHSGGGDKSRQGRGGGDKFLPVLCGCPLWMNPQLVPISWHCWDHKMLLITSYISHISTVASVRTSSLALHKSNMSYIRHVFGEFYTVDIWLCVACLQVQNATNANIKEKHEADLKKEIKKLQVWPCISVSMLFLINSV